MWRPSGSSVTVTGPSSPDAKDTSITDNGGAAVSVTNTGATATTKVDFSQGGNVLTGNNPDNVAVATSLNGVTVNGTGPVGNPNNPTTITTVIVP